VNKNAAARQLATAVDPASTSSEGKPPNCAPLPSHSAAAGATTKLCELLRSPNRLVRTAASYGLEAVLKTGTFLQRPASTQASAHSPPPTAEQWVPSASPADGVKQEVAVVPANRFSISLETLNLAQIIADDEPLLRDAAEKFDTAQAGGDGVDSVKKQLAGAIRGSFATLSRNSIRFALKTTHLCPALFCLPPRALCHLRLHTRTPPPPAPQSPPLQGCGCRGRAGRRHVRNFKCLVSAAFAGSRSARSQAQSRRITIRGIAAQPPSCCVQVNLSAGQRRCCRQRCCC